MKACGLNASQGELVYQYVCHLFFSLSLSSFHGRGGEQRGRRRQALAPLKWIYRGGDGRGARAVGGPRLKAEWQAVEAIKIEPLSLAARAL